MARLSSDTCDYCKHCYDCENWSCDIEEPCINGNMFKPKEENEKFNEIEIQLKAGEKNEQR